MPERHTVMVAARVTPAEHAAWQEKAAAAGVSPSASLREAMARTRTWTVPALAVESERIRQIARIGNNLNQIARLANTHKGAVEAIEVIAQLVVIERALVALAPPECPDADCCVPADSGSADSSDDLKRRNRGPRAEQLRDR